jgi:ubiquinone/menaquinone biosynthesis C-methylase UbiE
MPDNQTDSLLIKTRGFWDSNPCDGQPDVIKRMEFRYSKEPWLSGLLDEISKSSSVLEVGCGQGTDTLYCCQRMKQGSSYKGIDYSPESIASALASFREIKSALKIEPEFAVGNAEKLEFPDDTFQTVVSTGVLHHTPNTQQGINEINRVLKKGGTAYISLYRIWAPKIFLALFLRVLVRCVDGVSGKKGVVVKWVRKFGPSNSLGTMILEAVGVPILKAYTRIQMEEMFREFEIISIEPKGPGVPSLRINHWFGKNSNPLGALWVAVVKKTK